MVSPEERAQMQQAQSAVAAQPNVSVSVKADAQTPEGMQLLENEKLIQPGQAQQLMINQQQMAQQQAQTAAFEASQPQQGKKPPFMDRLKGGLSSARNAFFTPNPPGGGVN